MDKNFALFGKVMLVFLILFMVAGGAYYAGQNRTISETTGTPTPSPELDAIESTTTEDMILEDPQDTNSDVDSDTLMIETGSIKGVLGYPSSGIPPLKVYAISTTDSSVFFFTQTTLNQDAFTLEDVAPGTYNIVAYAEGNLAGGWTEMVPCGLSVECTDHSFIPVDVKAGETASGVEVRDWYAPDGTFPAMPK